MYCLLLDRQNEVRARQLEVLSNLADSDVVKLTHELSPHMDKLDVRARLPLVDLAMPALRAMTLPQFRSFSRCFDKLVLADNRLELFEWVLAQVLLWHLRPQFETGSFPPDSILWLSDVWPIPVRFYFQRSPTLATPMRELTEAFAAGARQLPELEARAQTTRGMWAGASARGAPRAYDGRRQAARTAGGCLCRFHLCGRSRFFTGGGAVTRYF